jgi:hypothetical protein
MKSNPPPKKNTNWHTLQVFVASIPHKAMLDFAYYNHLSHT